MKCCPFGIGLLVMAAIATVQAQGPLTPTAAPAASMITLDQMEPRTPLIGGLTNISIYQSGSYYLTGNMLGTITVLVSNVEIDLNGFWLYQIGSSPSALGLSSGSQNVKIHNGMIKAYYGISAPLTQTNNLTVEDVLLDGCVYGISAGHNLSARRIKGTNIGTQRFIQGGKGSLVQDSSMVGGNPSYGIEVGSGSLVENCTISAMKPSASGANTGIGTGSGSIVRHCSVSDSEVGATAFLGIYCGEGSLVSSCTVKGNQTTLSGYAFSPGSRSILENSVASGNTGITGVQVGSDSYIRNNAISESSAPNSSGIYLSGSGNRVEDNLVVGNSIGIRAWASGNFIARNTVSGNSTNWNIADGNVCYVLPAVTTTNFVGSGGGASPGTTNPYANFTF